MSCTSRGVFLSSPILLHRSQQNSIALPEESKYLSKLARSAIVVEKPHLDYWTKEALNVYVVIRDDEEAIRWMNLTRYLKQRRDKRSRRVVFEGEKLDAPAV